MRSRTRTHRHSHDIGGNHNGQGAPGDEDPRNYTGSELLLRWVQHGAVSPVLRTHCGFCERRAWVFERHAAQLFDALRLRNALVPYLYSEALRDYRAGVVPVRPLYHDWPRDAAAYAHNGSYLFGVAIVTAPITNITIEARLNGTGAIPWRTYLPAAAWADWRGTRGPAPILGPVVDEFAYGLADVPLFTRSAVLPLGSLATQSGDFADPLIWVVSGGHGAGLTARHAQSAPAPTASPTLPAIVCRCGPPYAPPPTAARECTVCWRTTAARAALPRRPRRSRARPGPRRLSQ